MRAYHFVGKTLRDGRPIPADGEWLEHDGTIEMCNSGLHASLHPFDALIYAPGETLCLVDVEGDVEQRSDKLICRRRRIVARLDATELLWAFSRNCALGVIHLWDAPAVVKEYLETGREDLRDAARDAAWEAAWSAAREAAWSAARDAARAAAREAAWDAAWDAARAAARDAAWAAAWSAARDAARAAAREAAWDAAWDAAWEAAWDAAWDAAWEAAWDAAWDAQREAFQAIVDAAFAEVMK